MKHLFLFICSTFLFSCLSAQTIERQVINSVGGVYINPSATIRISVGESIVGRRGSFPGVSQGFFTTTGISGPSGIADTKADAKVVISPNPARDQLYFSNSSDFQYLWYDSCA